MFLPIILKIPEKFRFTPGKGGTRDWGLNLLTYYPGFASPLEPQNAKFGLSCGRDTAMGAFWFLSRCWT